MFNLSPEIVEESREKLLRKKSTIPVGSLIKWMDPRISPLKLSNFLNGDINFFLDLPIILDKEPLNVVEEYVKAGFRIFSASTNPDWDEGYDDYISYLKRGKREFSYPVIRRDIFFESYQLVETRLFMGDSVTIFPSLVDDEHLEILIDDSANLEFDPVVIFSDEGEYKELKKFRGKFIVAVSMKNLSSLAKKARKLSQYVVVYHIESTKEIEELKDSGFKNFWISWKLVDSFPEYFNLVGEKR